MQTYHAVSQHTSLTAAAYVDPHASYRPSPKYGLKHLNIAARRPRLRADDATHTAPLISCYQFACESLRHTIQPSRYAAYPVHFILPAS